MGCRGEVEHPPGQLEARAEEGDEGEGRPARGERSGPQAAGRRPKSASARAERVGPLNCGNTAPVKGIEPEASSSRAVVVLRYFVAVVMVGKSVPATG